MDLANKCEGSNQRPTEVTVQARQKPDDYGNLLGPTGRGVCPGCGREVGLNSQGNIARHNAPDQED